MIPTTRIHDLARRTAQRFVNDEDPGQRLYIFEGRHLEHFAQVLLSDGKEPPDTEGDEV